MARVPSLRQSAATTLKVVANYYLGEAFWFAGEPRRAVEPLRTAIALVKGAPLGERFGLTGLPAVVARWALAEVLAEQGEFVEAVVAGQEGLQIAETVEHRYSEVWARYALGYVHLRQGDFAGATRVLEPGVALCRELELRVALPFVAASLGSTLLWSGRAAEAVPLLEEAVEALTTMGIVGLRSLFVTFLAEAYLVLGRVAEARQHAEQSLAPARAHQERGWRAWALKLLGDILVHESAKVVQGAAVQGAVAQGGGDRSGAEQPGRHTGKRSLCD
jgi:tetratricopeptide (TPR) repeat protein